MKDTNDAQCYTSRERAMADALFDQAYDALLTLARNRRRRTGVSHTMMTDDILHECFLKLSGTTVWQSPQQFMCTASLAIRQVIVDHARRKLTQKRGCGETNLAYEEGDSVLPEYNETPEQIVIVNDLLEKLETSQPRLSKVVDARYFAAMTEAETATALGFSERTVRRDWQTARSWLAEKMEIKAG